MSAHQTEVVAVADALFADVRGWLQTHMSKEMRWLLIHADDGVIWGRREPDGSLLLSSDVFDVKSQYPAIAVELRAETLQQARLFGPGGELLVWRDGAGFQGRRIMDGDGRSKDVWHEQHILWGETTKQMTGFSLLEEGQQGPQHAVPLTVPPGRRAALTVRHYLAPDENGQAVIELSRLVDLGLFDPMKGS